MCGIAGCVTGPGRAPDRRALERMAAAMAHRGPDDSGVEVLGSVGLAHTRLSIVDPSPAGHQPMAGADERWWLTYNGEIFNHLELREQLPGIRWRGGSDTETLLHALDTWGADAVARCNGLYAYAALDVERRRLLLVRDRFGVKPLYWARHDGALWFASEVGALFAAGLPRAARRDVLRHVLEVGWANGLATPVAGVRRVGPGAWLEVSLDTLAVEEHEWYDPTEHVDPERMAALASLDAESAATELEAALRASVRRRLMADVPVGTMCSGGVDSSLLTALAHQEQGDIHAFNASVIDQPDNDEAPFAAQVAASVGVELHTVAMDGDWWRRRLVTAVRHNEYPLLHMSSVPMAGIAELAHQRGVKVLLSGEGADELLGGYPWVHGAAVSDYLLRRHPIQSPARWLYRHLQRRGWGRPLDVWPPPGPSEEVTAYQAAVKERANAAYAHHRGRRRRLEMEFAAYLRLYLPHLLNRQDKSTMLYSIETRVPFLDPEVVSLSLNLPLELRVEPRRKELLRIVARRHLPAEIIDRRKIGFGWNVEEYLLPAVRREFLAEGMLREELGVARERWEPFVDVLSGVAALLFWTGEIWCRQMLAGQSDAEIDAALWRDLDLSAAG